MIAQIAQPQLPMLILVAVVIEGVTQKIRQRRDAARRYYTRVKADLRTWRIALRAAHAYDAKHRYRRREPSVNHHDRVRVYAPAPQRMAQRRDGRWEENLQASIRNTRLIMSGAEGPEERVYAEPAPSHLGRHSHQDGADNRGAESVLPREGGRHHHRFMLPYRRRRVQRPAEGLHTRDAAVHDLVSEDVWYRAIA